MIQVGRLRFDADTLCRYAFCMSNPLLTAKKVAESIGLPDATSIKRLARQRKIPFIRLGHRTLLFDPAKVRAAIDKLEVRPIA